MEQSKNIFDFNEQASKGKILLSEPFMEDPNFKRTVVLLCEHNAEGTFGFILNKKTELLLGDAVPELEHFETPLYYGGPVEPQTLHYVHQSGDILPESVPIGDGIFWGGQFETLKILLKNKEINPDTIRFFTGYSGWDPDQIVEELKQNSWFVTSSDVEDIFHKDDEHLWKKILNELGGDFKTIANYPENPNWN